MIKRFAFLLSLLLPLAGCGKKSDVSSGPSAVKDVRPQIEAGGEIDPIAVPTALHGGSLTLWAGPFPKSLNMWLDQHVPTPQIYGLMFEPLLEMHSTKDQPIGDVAQ